MNISKKLSTAAVAGGAIPSVAVLGDLTQPVAITVCVCLTLVACMYIWRQGKVDEELARFAPQDKE